MASDTPCVDPTMHFRHGDQNFLTRHPPYEWKPSRISIKPPRTLTNDFGGLFRSDPALLARVLHGGVEVPRFWSFLLTLCTRRSPNMELNPIVLARSSILCRKTFPNQGGVRTKGRLKELGNRVAIPVRRLACALRPASSCKGIAVSWRNFGQESSSFAGRDFRAKPACGSVPWRKLRESGRL